MAVNDQIADMLIRIKNAANAKFDKVVVPHSKMKESIVKVIAGEGFLGGVEVVGDGVHKNLVVELKYKADGKPVFAEMSRVSKLGRRSYTGAKDIRPSRQGMGMCVISTSKGVMKDTDAKRQGLGGEVICSIW